MLKAIFLNYPVQNLPILDSGLEYKGHLDKGSTVTFFTQPTKKVSIKHFKRGIRIAENYPPSLYLAARRSGRRAVNAR